MILSRGSKEILLKKTQARVSVQRGSDLHQQQSPVEARFLLRQSVLSKLHLLDQVFGS